MMHSLIDWWGTLALLPQLLLVFNFVIAVLLINQILLWISYGVRSCLHNPEVSLHELNY